MSSEKCLGCRKVHPEDFGSGLYIAHMDSHPSESGLHFRPPPIKRVPFRSVTGNGNPALDLAQHIQKLLHFHFAVFVRLPVRSDVRRVTVDSIRKGKLDTRSMISTAGAVLQLDAAHSLCQPLDPSLRRESDSAGFFLIRRQPKTRIRTRYEPTAKLQCP